MRKIFILALALLMLCMLCACEQEMQINGSSGSTPATDSSVPSVSSTVTDCTKGHLFPDNAEVCQRCGANYFSETLEFMLSDSGDYYIVSGPGTCRRALIKVPAVHRGLPVAEIGVDAFAECTFLENITLPESLVKIDDGAFSYCISLKEIIVPENVTHIGYLAFAFCESLIRLELHDGITSLGECMLMYCKSLENLHIPSTITEIPSQFAVGCTSLKTVTTGGRIKSVGANAFESCTSMEAFDFGDSLETIADCAFYNCSSLQLAALPETVRYIGGGAFSMCTALRSINIPQALQEIGGNPFNGCDALQFNVYKGTTYLGNDTNPYLVFVGRENASIKNIVIHEDTVFVPINDLSESDIESLYIGRSVSEFMVGAFRRNNTLSRIEVSSENKTYHASGNCLIDTAKKLMILGCKNSVIPNDDSVIKIASQVFKDMQGVTSVVIPDAVKELGFNLFWDCTDLETLVIGTGVQKIESDIFSGREKLSMIFYHGTKEQWEAIHIVGRTATGGILQAGNVELFRKNVYFYSEEKPTEEGNYWHYVDGKPTPWEAAT